MDSAEERRSARANVLLTATIVDGGRSIPVRVGNLSAHGALVIGKGLPARDAVVTFRCNEAEVAGIVSWAESGRAGIEFDQPIDLSELARKAPPVIETVKDRREVSYRRPGFRGNQLSEEEQRIVEQFRRPRSDRKGED